VTPSEGVFASLGVGIGASSPAGTSSMTAAVDNGFSICAADGFGRRGCHGPFLDSLSEDFDD
jgi:hypothetical protein